MLASPQFVFLHLTMAPPLIKSWMQPCYVSYVRANVGASWSLNLMVFNLAFRTKIA